MIGGTSNDSLLTRVQMVRHGQPTEWGPNLSEGGAAQCATTLQDGSVIVTGGVSETHFGVAKTEIYNSTTKMWERKADMKQRRMKHSCANLWVDPLPEADGIVPSQLTPTSVLSVAVAGGICMLYFITTRCQV